MSDSIDAPGLRGLFVMLVAAYVVVEWHLLLDMGPCPCLLLWVGIVIACWLCCLARVGGITHRMGVGLMACWLELWSLSCSRCLDVSIVRTILH